MSMLDVDFESILDRFLYRKYDINRRVLDIDFRSRIGFGLIYRPKIDIQNTSIDMELSISKINQKLAFFRFGYVNNI